MNHIFHDSKINLCSNIYVETYMNNDYSSFRDARSYIDYA